MPGAALLHDAGCLPALLHAGSLSALLLCSDLLQIVLFSLLLGDTKPPKKLTKNPTVGTVVSVVTVVMVGMVEAFGPNIYRVLAHVRPSAAPVVRYLLCLSTCAPGVGAHGGSR